MVSPSGYQKWLIIELAQYTRDHFGTQEEVTCLYSDIIHRPNVVPFFDFTLTLCVLFLSDIVVGSATVLLPLLLGRRKIIIMNHTHFVV